MSVKSVIASAGLIGAALATLIYFREPIGNFVKDYTGAIGKEIRCGVDFLGIYEDCKKNNSGNIDQGGQDKGYIEPRKGDVQTLGENECTYLGNGQWSCKDKLGTYKLSNPGKPNAMIDDQTISQYSANVIKNIGSTKASDWTQSAKASYQDLLRKVTDLKDLRSISQPDVNGLYRITWKGGSSTFAPLTQAAVDYYKKNGISVTRV